MPELPEVETIINVLRPLILNKKIEKVEVFYDRMILSNVFDFKNNLQNQKFIGLTRKGKFLIFHLTNSFVLLSHLRMEGKYGIKKKDEENPDHTHVIFYLEGDEKLIYYDTRKFGIMKLTTEDRYLVEEPISKLGIEPMDINDSNKAILYNKLFKKKPIKELLLDQTIMSGIGNIYADEICYATKINPLTPGNKLNISDYDNIFSNASRILKLAISSGGSTIKSYHPSEGIDGKFQVLLHAYGKSGQQCPNCGTVFHKIFLNGRGTTFCPNCQINHELQKAIGITGPIGSGKSLALNVFKENGFVIVDCDKIVKELYQDPYVIRKMGLILGNKVISNGKLNTKEMRNIMESDHTKQKQVEQFVFPLVENKLIDVIQTNEKVVIEIQLLLKAHLEYLFKKVLLLQASNEKLLSHIAERNYSNPQGAIDMYFKDNDLSKIKDPIIVNNNGSKENFVEQIQEIVNKC